MALFDKHFTVQQARDELPSLRERFARIHALYGEIAELRGDFERVQQLIRMNGHAPRETHFEERLSALQNIVRTIVDQGIEVKDIGRGLVDFPHWRDDEEVFLCWELAEDDLCFWHRIEDGFAGRQPLEP